MKLHEDVLAFCNRIREEQGLKPIKKLPRGVQRSNTCCPVARALQPLDPCVNGRTVRFNTRNDNFWRATKILPKYVGTFIGRFDRGDFPELVKR